VVIVEVLEAGVDPLVGDGVDRVQLERGGLDPVNPSCSRMVWSGFRTVGFQDSGVVLLKEDDMGRMGPSVD
jgi:hypothetical protein